MITIRVRSQSLSTRLNTQTSKIKSLIDSLLEDGQIHSYTLTDGVYALNIPLATELALEGLFETTLPKIISSSNDV